MMAIIVNLKFDFTLELYNKSFENDGVPPHLVWKLRFYLDFAAQNLLVSIAKCDLEDTVELLKHHTLLEIHEDQILASVDNTLE